MIIWGIVGALAIKVILRWIIKISLLEPSVVTWQYHWESSTLRPFFAWSTILSSSSSLFWYVQNKFRFFAAPPTMMAFPQSLQLLLNIPGSTPSLSQWLAIIWMSHSIWNWDTWMNIIGYFPIDPFGFKTPPWLPPAPPRMYLWGGVSLPRCYWPQDLRPGTEHACVFGRLIFNGTSGPFKTWGRDRGDRAD